MQIAVDAMGGDHGPSATVVGAASAVTCVKDLEVRLFGPKHPLEEQISCLPRHLAAAGSYMSVVNAPGVIDQQCRVADALRHGAGTSMAKMLDCIAAGDAQAGVSAGNTGALMALSRRTIGTVRGISRPAISTSIPTRQQGRCYLLDLGANVEVPAERLVEFALMGAAMARHVDGLDSPRVALLNLGVEESKGPSSVRQADALLRNQPDIAYVGFMEGDGIFSGDADVVVCDGFVGNAVLKASEGLAKMLVERVQTTFKAHWGSRLVGAMALPALRRLKRELDPVRYNGASLLGLDGIVIKSHGSADATGFHYAVLRAVQEVNRNLPRQLAVELGQQWPVGDSLASDDRSARRPCTGASDSPVRPDGDTRQKSKGD